MFAQQAATTINSHTMVSKIP